MGKLIDFYDEICAVTYLESNIGVNRQLRRHIQLDHEVSLDYG